MGLVRETCGKWPSGLKQDQIGGFTLQSPLSTQLGLATQPHYESPSDLRGYGKNKVISIG